MIFNMISGGAALNFDVKAYASEEALLAATPAENTIGVVTTTDITSWEFTSEEPSAPEEGMVWFSTGFSSSIEFNALKKNGIQVYPLFAKQYISGTFVDVTAMSYQGGEWHEWAVYLFNYGEQGYQWKARGWKYNDASHIAQTPTVTNNTDGSVKISISSSADNFVGGGVYELASDFDLSNIATLEIDCVCARTTTGGHVHIAVVPRAATYWYSGAVAKANIGNSGEQKVTLDVSQISGYYDIVVGLLINSYVQGTGTLSCNMKTLKAVRG